jgi:RNA polymerase primary sigma factor
MIEMHTLQPIPPTSTELGNLISHGKQRGYVTADEVQHAVPAAEEAAEALDAILDNLNKNGIRIIDEETDAPVGPNGIDEDLGNEHYDALLGDSVRLYLREIGLVALLTPDEERELAQRIKDGQKAELELAKLANQPLLAAAEAALRKQGEELRKQVKVGKEAREKMAAANLRLVVSIAKRYRERGLPLLDLIQEGSVGLLRAIEKFDVSKGYKFSTYATWWIKQALSRALSDQSRLVRLPVHLGETLNRIQSARRELTQKEGRDPTDKELALYLDLPEERLRELRRTAQDPISLAMPVGEEADSTLADFIPDPHAIDADDAAANGMLNDQIWKALGNLTKRESDVLALRYGLKDGQPHTLEEVGRYFGVTRERVRQIEVKALRKLRHPRLNKLLKDYIDPV